MLCQLYAITGYLYEYVVADCQDAMPSQYAIHHEVQDIAPTNVIFDDSITNIDLYVNRFVEVDLGLPVLSAWRFKSKILAYLMIVNIL